MEAQWYYTLSGQQNGPVPETQLRSLLQSGQVPNNEFVFKEGMADWVVASSCSELLTGAPSTAPMVPMVPAPPAAGGQLELGAIYKEAFEIFKVQWLPLCLGILIIGAPNMVLSNMGKLVPERVIPILDFASVLITAPLLLGGWILFLNAVDRREVSVNQIWDGFQRYVPALIVDLIRHAPLLPGWSLMVVLPAAGAVVALLGLLPFFACLLFFAFAYAFLADRKCPPIEAIKLSFNCVKDNIVIVLVLGVMVIPLMIGGLLAALVGVIPAGAFWMLSLAVAYRWINPQTPQA